MAHVAGHCQMPWWKRPPVWILAIVAALLLGVTVVEKIDTRALMPYSTFLDQLKAGNVASVRFQGTEIKGHFKLPLEKSPTGGSEQGVLFQSRVPDIGDHALIPELRKQHVVIEVASPSAWIRLLGRLPWPMLILIPLMLVAGFVRLVRGGKAQSGSAAPMHPMQAMMGLMGGLFGKDQGAASPPLDNAEKGGSGIPLEANGNKAGLPGGRE